MEWIKLAADDVTLTEPLRALICPRSVTTCSLDNNFPVMRNRPLRRWNESPVH
jgi:hypothetical protein